MGEPFGLRKVDRDTLTPLVRAVVQEVVTALPAGREGFLEPEAAALLGVKRTVLRDARLRGEVSARKVGKQYAYGRLALLRWLNGNAAN